MVAVKEITWEEASAPDFEHTTRQAFRAAVDQVAARAKATLPECNGRVEKAVAIVLPAMWSCSPTAMPGSPASVRARSCTGSSTVRATVPTSPGAVILV